LSSFSAALFLCISRTFPLSVVFFFFCLNSDEFVSLSRSVLARKPDWLFLKTKWFVVLKWKLGVSSWRHENRMSSVTDGD
jgi:hypothetical protein